MKPKQNVGGSLKKAGNYDQCQTPYYALDPLIPYLPKSILWESASGDGHIVQKLRLEGFNIIDSDIFANQNFFEYQPDFWDCQVTNPPYSIKYDWLQRSYELKKPFALLMPLETLGAARGQELYQEYGVEIILLNKRVNFKMPFKGYRGSGAQFPVAWFTHGLGIGETITFGKIYYYQDKQLPLIKMIYYYQDEQLPLFLVKGENK